MDYPRWIVDCRRMPMAPIGNLKMKMTWKDRNLKGLGFFYLQASHPAVSTSTWQKHLMVFHLSFKLPLLRYSRVQLCALTYSSPHSVLPFFFPYKNMKKTLVDWYKGTAQLCWKKNKKAAAVEIKSLSSLGPIECTNKWCIHPCECIVNCHIIF